MPESSIQDKLSNQIRCIRSASDAYRHVGKGPWRVSIRRALAFVSDLTIIYGLGLIADHLIGKRLLPIGDDGWWIGIIVMALYFSIFDSSIGRGKSRGTRLFRIEVTRIDGTQLSPFDAFLRCTPFLIIFASWNCLERVDAYSISSVFISFATNLVLISIITFGLTHPYRRSVHDLIMDSIVVKRDDAFAVAPASIKYSIMAFAVAAVFAAQFSFMPDIMNALGKNGAKLSEFREKVLISQGLKNPRVDSRFIYSDGGFVRAMVVSGYMTGSANISESSIAQDLSRKISGYISARRLVFPGTKRVVVKIRSGYDTGIGPGLVEARRVYPYTRTVIPAGGNVNRMQKGDIRKRLR